MRDLRVHRLLAELLDRCGDVESNPGPPSKREPKPDPKKIMEEKVNSHDEKLGVLEKLFEEQKKALEEMNEKQRSTDETISEIKDDIRNIQSQLTGSLTQLGDQTSGTDSKMRELGQALEEVQDKLWELDKSWQNNLVFYGVREEQGREETQAICEGKIREIIRIRLGITREVHILRVRRSYTGTNVRGCKPITVYFQKYEDKEEILRKTKFLSGSNIYIAEDFSKRVKDRRSELTKFMKKMKKRQPLSKFFLRYDRLIIDKDVYTFNEMTGQVELATLGQHGEEQDMTSTSSPTTPHRYRKKSGGRKKMEKSFSTDSALNHLVDGPAYDDDSREPSPTKSILSMNDEAGDGLRQDSKSRPGSPQEDRLDGEDLAIANNYSNINTYNGPLRKSNPDIPETIREDE